MNYKKYQNTKMEKFIEAYWILFEMPKKKKDSYHRLRTFLDPINREIVARIVDYHTFSDIAGTLELESGNLEKRIRGFRRIGMKA